MPQVKHRKVSAAEKRAELEARGEQPPVCDCHGEAKYWNSDQEYSAGGYWRCAERVRERQREYERERYWSDPMHRVVKNIRRVANRNQRKRRALHGN